jgi:diguanylate cyclase (GGDEF)-like protein/PAS domain S-box-containing protein
MIDDGTLTAQRRYRRLLDRSPAAVWAHDGRLVCYVNRSAAQLLGATSMDVILGRPLSQFVHADSLHLFSGQIATASDDEPSVAAEAVLVDSGGTPVRVQMVTSCSTWRGQPIYEVAMAPAAGSDPQLHVVLDALHQGVVIMDSNGRFEFTNRAARHMLGAKAQDLAGLRHSDEAADLPLYDAQGRPMRTNGHPIRFIQQTGVTLSGEVIGVDRADGQRIWVTGHGCLLDPTDVANSSVLFSFTDITDHYVMRQRLSHEATHDGLTGLRTRGYALDIARSSLNSTAAGRLSAVLFIDLDKLKVINDAHGHIVGDCVLQVAAQRLQSVARPQDVLARLGGDEFVMLMIGDVGHQELDLFARRLHDVLSEDIDVGPLTMRVSASIGITAISRDDPRDANEVLRDADAAMYTAKARGPGNTWLFTPSSSEPNADHAPT